MSKKKHHDEAEEEEVAPFWMISFSDLMTLLLSFFVILFSISTIEEKKMEELMQAMGERYLRGGMAHSGNKDIRSDPNLPKAKRQTADPEGGKSLTLESKKKETESNRTVVPFKLEDSTLDDNNKKTLSKIAESMQGLPYQIVVRGHASTREKSRMVIDDLAYERAWNVRDYLLTLGLNPKRFSLSVVGSNDPLVGVTLPPGYGDENTYAEVFMENE